MLIQDVSAGTEEESVGEVSGSTAPTGGASRLFRALGMGSLWDDYMNDDPNDPRLISWKLTCVAPKEKEGTENIYEIAYVYEANGLQFPISLPIYINLEPRLPEPYSEEDDDHAKDHHQLTMAQSFKKNLATYRENFLSFIYRPSIIYIIGFGALINAFKIAYNAKKSNISILSQIGRSSYFALSILGLSVIYFTPLLFSYARTKVESRLTNTFADIEKDIIEENIDSAALKIQGLSVRSNILYNILLHDKFPNNSDLRWKYYYLKGNIYEQQPMYGRADYAYMKAFKLSDTSDKKFLSLRGLIDMYGRYGAVDNYGKSREGRYDVAYYQAKAKEYLAKMPRSSVMYRKFGASLESKLRECTNSLIDNNCVEAARKFLKIKLGYCHEFFYPGITVLYYHISIAINLCMDKHTKVPCERWSLRNASYGLAKVQEFIDKCYPERSAGHQEYIDQLETFINSLPKSPDKKSKRTMTPFADSKLSSVLEDKEAIRKLVGEESIDEPSANTNYVKKSPQP